jgi:hypothetical protein
MSSAADIDHDCMRWEPSNTNRDDNILMGYEIHNPHLYVLPCTAEYEHSRVISN